MLDVPIVPQEVELQLTLCGERVLFLFVNARCRREIPFFLGAE